jgi:transposase-like protein
MPGNATRRYPRALRERGVRMVAEIREDQESQWAAMAKVAELLEVGTPETVRTWVRRAEVDAGRRPGVHHRGDRGTEAVEAGERRAQGCQRDLAECLGFLRGRARPATALIVAYIDSVAGHRDQGGLRWGVESICVQLTELGATIAPATYSEHRGRGPTAGSGPRPGAEPSGRCSARGHLRRLRGPGRSG